MKPPPVDAPAEPGFEVCPPECAPPLGVAGAPPFGPPGFPAFDEAPPAPASEVLFPPHPTATVNRISAPKLSSRIRFIIRPSVVSWGGIPQKSANSSLTGPPSIAYRQWSIDWLRTRRKRCPRPVFARHGAPRRSPAWIT